MLTNEKLKLTNNAKVMHCLPVRRNVELSDEILDGPNSIVTQQAANRVWAAQAVFEILRNIEWINLFIIKIGGNIIDDEIKLSSFLKDFASLDDKKNPGSWRRQIGNKTGRTIRR